MLDAARARSTPGPKRATTRRLFSAAGPTQRLELQGLCSAPSALVAFAAWAGPRELMPAAAAAAAAAAPLLSPCRRLVLTLLFQNHNPILAPPQWPVQSPSASPSRRINLHKRIVAPPIDLRNPRKKNQAPTIELSDAMQHSTSYARTNAALRHRFDFLRLHVRFQLVVARTLAGLTAAAQMRDCTLALLAMHMHATAYASVLLVQGDRATPSCSGHAASSMIHVMHRKSRASISTWCYYQYYQQSGHGSGISKLLPAFGHRVLDQLQSDSDLDVLALAWGFLLPTKSDRAVVSKRSIDEQHGDSIVSFSFCCLLYVLRYAVSASQLRPLYLMLMAAGVEVPSSYGVYARQLHMPTSSGGFPSALHTRGTPPPLLAPCNGATFDASANMGNAANHGLQQRAFPHRSGHNVHLNVVPRRVGGSHSAAITTPWSLALQTHVALRVAPVSGGMEHLMPSTAYVRTPYTAPNPPLYPPHALQTLPHDALHHAV
ncbi:hypothetical protein TGAM01_v206962 [Trichoderma gamsii]|uniref:Uncharacterized protein n=1 Tax=Trichoderma gamsii TaxID=398673 RepID=A0A2P4ZJ12_9HYPO|nr:hypothetical protein TGAM01_v206962 [Trichoderma gamsii]PON24274.1 hypothetical protein TGAM01_v206962 [Trichoderma gamsii]